MNYNELLEKMSSNMINAYNQREQQNKSFVARESSPNKDTTNILLNKIGLEAQRQGGY